MVDEGVVLNQQIAIVRFFFFNYWGMIEQYIKNKHLYETTILYEDLCEDPRKLLGHVFSALEISSDHISAALKTMENDSHMGLFGKRGSYPNKDEISTIDMLETKFKECNIPLTINMSMADFRNLLN